MMQITLVSIMALGFFLGMRHATDPDHVIAVTTIVSRQRSFRQAAFIGLLWGLGHTITIFVVGSVIILFGLVIPPRIGLSMELRSEEHTSELQSRGHLVCRLLLEKKKKQKKT